MRNLAMALGALMTISTLGACAAPVERETGLSALPEGTRWRLDSSSVEGLKAGADTGISMAFTQGRLTGDSGCNQFFADASVVDGGLKLGPIGASKRACIGPRMASEQALFAALASLDGAAVVGGRLRLVTTEGTEMVFVKDASAAE
jgi:heat shock protein HslJ